jgi:hypothetical protein
VRLAAYPWYCFAIRGNNFDLVPAVGRNRSKSIRVISAIRGPVRPSATTSRNATPFRIPAGPQFAYNPDVNERPKSKVVVWAPKVVVALSVYVVVLAPWSVEAQRPVQRARPVMAGTVMVPRVINGRAVESAVINRVVLVFGELAVAEEPAVVADPEVAEDAVAAETPVGPPPKPKQRVIVFSGTFDELVYGSGSHAAELPARLYNRLQQKLEKIDRISELTEAQKRKLQLAGRGDLKRLFDRAEKLRVKCDRYAEIDDLNQFRQWTEELKSETSALRQSFDAGPFGEDSLMAKCMKSVLTTDQAAKYARFGATPDYQAPERRPGRFEGAIELR